jgi:hypothetical protein
MLWRVHGMRRVPTNWLTCHTSKAWQGLGAILQCGDMTGRRISGLLRNEERLAKFS